MQTKSSFLFFIIVAAFIFLSNLILPYSQQQEPIRFYTEKIHIHDFLFFILLFLLLLPLHVFWSKNPLQRIADKVSQGFLTIPSGVYEGVLFAVVFASSLWIGLVCLGGQPIFSDEIAYLIQAKIFAGTHITAPARYGPAENYAQLIVDNGRLYSIFPPGHSLLLTVGVFLGKPEFIGPLLGALCLILWMRWLRFQYDEITVRLAGLFFALSPTVLLLSASYFSHSSCLFWFLLYLLSITKVTKKFSMENARTLLDYVVAGFSAGMLLITRQLDALALVVVAGALIWAWPAWKEIKQNRSSESQWIRNLSKNLLFAFAAFILPLFFQLYYNWIAFGNPFASGYVKNFGAFPYGFGDNIFETRHTWIKAFEYALKYFNFMGVQSVFWPIHAVIPVMVVVLALLWPKSPNLDSPVGDRISLCIILAYVLFYMPFPVYSPVLGARFYYPIVPFWILLSLRGVQLFLYSAAPTLRPALVSTLIWIAIPFYLFSAFQQIPALHAYLQSPYYSDSHYSPEHDLAERMSEFQVEKSLGLMTLDPKRQLLGGMGFRYNEPYGQAPHCFIYDQGPLSSFIQIVRHPYVVPFQIDLHDSAHPTITPIMAEPVLQVQVASNSQDRVSLTQLSPDNSKDNQWTVALPELPAGRKIQGFEVHALDNETGHILSRWSTLTPQVPPLLVEDAKGQKVPLDSDLYFRDPAQGYALPPGMPTLFRLTGAITTSLPEMSTAAYRVWVICSDKALLFGGTSTHHPLNWAFVCDSLASYREIDGTIDKDRSDNTALAIRWNCLFKDVALFHIYVQTGDFKPVYLGTTENGTTQHFEWRAYAPGLNPEFIKGPQSGQSYRFQIFAIKKDGTGFYGPIRTHSPVGIEYIPIAYLLLILVSLSLGVLILSAYWHFRKNIESIPSQESG